jgi:hypothetical protein
VYTVLAIVAALPTGTASKNCLLPGFTSTCTEEHWPRPGSRDARVAGQNTEPVK